MALSRAGRGRWEMVGLESREGKRRRDGKEKGCRKAAKKQHRAGLGQGGGGRDHRSGSIKGDWSWGKELGHPGFTPVKDSAVLRKK